MTSTSISVRTPLECAIERWTAAMVITTCLPATANFLQDKEAAGGHAAPSRKPSRFSLARETHADKRPKYPRVEVLPRGPGGLASRCESQEAGWPDQVR